MNRKFALFICMILIGITSLHAEDEWYKLYAEGHKAMKSKKYELAISLFEKAISEKENDIEKVRTYGMHYIQYYPNREAGIAYYFLGNKEKAAFYLNRSKKMAPSSRAIEYLKKLESKNLPSVTKTEVPAVLPSVSTDNRENPDKMIVGKKTIKLVGERMSVAIFPFENKGASKDLGEIILDKMITAFFNQARFKVIERTQLDKILEEQQLGLTGVLDASSAAKLGKGIGVDAIIMGSVAATPSGAISIDSRAIDTESATIIVAHDAYSGSSDALSVKNAVENLANKFTESLPLVDGTVIQVNDGNTILLDGGRMGGLKKGLKCIIYKEGPELKHPLTGEVLGRKTIILGEALVIESLEKYSTAKIIKTDSDQIISMGDKFLTK